MNWVKLSERKPPREAKYIVHAPSADPDCPLITMAWYHPSTDEWSLTPTLWAGAITHWMNKPDPPPPD